MTIAGCGGGGSSSTSADRATPTSTVPANAPKPPKGASPTLRAIYNQFPPPSQDPKVKGSAKAIAAGMRACKGKSAAALAKRYYAIAVAQGRLDPHSPEAKMIAQVDKYAKNAAKDPGFTAGQLAADAYQATLAPKLGSFGYQGCVYALARGLEYELAPKR
jgi:hypothetical protein